MLELWPKYIDTYFNDITKIIQDLKTEFKEDLETLKRPSPNKDRIKNSISQYKNPGESLISRMNQAEKRISELGDKVENLDKISKEKWNCLSSTG